MNPPAAAPELKLAHFSDIHVTTRPLGWRGRDWFSKKMTGWVNIALLGRGYRFRHADSVLRAMMKDIRDRRPDHLVFSGDATTLGFESELAYAVEGLGIGGTTNTPGIAVPGNHDYYTRSDQASGRFERLFAAWQSGERVDGAAYPFAQRLGRFWLVGVNTSAGNLWTWDASGRIDAPQLDRLDRLLQRLDPGPRILVTHYPACMPDGRPERKTHGLRNASELVAVARRGGVCLWLHGHRHGAYHVCLPDFAPFPLVCAGSATQHGRWSYAQHEISGNTCVVNRRVYSETSKSFTDGERFSLELPTGSTV
jgi:3',5'-cyclic AMP phosphodiesterase CpdA